MLGEDFIVRGSGVPVRQFIYSEDLAHLILKILFSNNHVDNIILSCSEYDEVSIAEIARYIAKQFDYENRIQFDESYSDGQYKKTASNFRITQMYPDFEFTPIEEGIEKTVKWFLENPELVRR
jgi:GDP-L-fucose synthase